MNQHTIQKGYKRTGKSSVTIEHDCKEPQQSNNAAPGQKAIVSIVRA